MRYEIEIKAWVDEPELLRERLTEFALFDRYFEKLDTYYLGPPALETSGTEAPLDRRFRLRSDDGKAIVTYKEKSMQGGMETNLEHEFEVSDPKAFLSLVEALGCVEQIRKKKTGSSYNFGELLIELSEVEGLGFFIEIEKITDRNDEETTQAARAEILSALDLAGVSRDRIEERYYTDMLAEKKTRDTGAIE